MTEGEAALAAVQRAGALQYGALRLGADALHRVCDAATLGFKTTAELEPHAATQYQEDAVAGLSFGLSMTPPGYNVFVLGARGSGRRTHTRDAVQRLARSAPPPPDWCYVANFREPREPKALSVTAGHGTELQADVARTIDELQEAIRRLLQSDTVAARRAALIEEREKQATSAVEEMEQELAADEYVSLVRTPESLDIVPARGNEPLRREAYVQLPADVREKIDEHVRAAQARHVAVHRRIDELRREAAEQVKAYHREVMAEEIERRLAPLHEKYAAFEAVREHLSAMAEDVLEHIDQFLATLPAELEGPARAFLAAAQNGFLRRYLVNVLTSRAPDAGAPVIEEPNPTLINLLGRVEYHMEFGVMTTDFTRIAAGALQRANGGFLILDAEELLTRPLAWPALKRVLRTGLLQPTEASAEIGLVATESMRPQPIPARVKVVLIGEPRTYYLLQALDSEFGDLFKVKADFRPHTERNAESERGYAAFIARRCREDGLPALDAAAVARTIEEGSRLAADQQRLTTRLGDVHDLVREAAQLAGEAGADVVSAVHIESALGARERRNARPHRELLDLIRRGVLRFDPTGRAAGELYGIGLIGAGGTVFGRPIRVMASAFLGTGGVIDIEREAKLSGPIHQKGFLVLSGYLGRRFARRSPLILSASVSFDQLYEEVEGDSASAAELYALMSAIGNVPLHQGIAVTGAVNQEGLILPVGGVTEKIEGFFAACEAVGLTGEQGVILPRANLQHIAVRQNVRDAVHEGRFRIWAIDRIEHGWPMLAGLEAGEERDGGYAEGTVHSAVQKQLTVWARQWKSFGRTKRASAALAR